MTQPTASFTIDKRYEPLRPSDIDRGRERSLAVDNVIDFYNKAHCLSKLLYDPFGGFKFAGMSTDH